MKLGSIKEDIKIEKRVAITPEIAKKFIDSGFEVNLEKNYANHLGFEDKAYEILNVNILDNKELVLERSEIIAQLNLPSKSTLEILDQNKTLIGVLNPYLNSEELNNLVKKKNKLFFIRITSKNYTSTIYGCTFVSSKFGWL